VAPFASVKKGTGMNQSETITELAKALSKAQAVMEGAKKDSQNPHLKNKYADLASVWDACRKPLTDNGLSVVQLTDGGPETVTILTRLLHISGEWLEGSLTLKPVKQDPQGIGSVVTYGRRYSLMAMVGISPEDDDGNEASAGRDASKQQSSKPSKPPSVAVGEEESPLQKARREFEEKQKAKGVS
jgi:hypothetical protein